MNSELFNSFCHACSNLKRAFVLNGLCEIRKVVRSKNYLYKYKADHTLFIRIPLREEARYLLAYTYIYQSDLSSCGQALYLTVYTLRARDEFIQPIFYKRFDCFSL